MGNIFELDEPMRVSGFARCVPGPVRRLDAGTLSNGTLLLRWKAPVGGSFISGYCIERTREGREYEVLGETRKTVFFARGVPPGEPWFYRVRAFNAKGDGAFRLVWLFRRHDPVAENDSHRNHLLMPVAVIPGLQVTVFE